MGRIETIHLITRVVNWEYLEHIEQSIRATLDGIPFKWWVTFEPPAKCCPALATMVPWQSVDGAAYGLDRYNHVLDLIEDGWVYGLDDDNALHPRFREAVRYMHRCDGMMFQQEHRPLCPFPSDKKTRFVKSFVDVGAGGTPEAGPPGFRGIKKAVRREVRSSFVTVGGLLSRKWSWMTERNSPPAEPKPWRIDLGMYLLKRSLIGDTRMRYEAIADGIFIQELFQAHPGKIISVFEPMAFYNYLRTPRPWWWEKGASQWCSDLAGLVKRWVLLKLGRPVRPSGTARR